MGGFVKIYQTILDSSIWLEDQAVRIVWLTMLAMADSEGFVCASVGGLAHRARVERDDCDRALEVLSSPDPDSKDPSNEGRRIEKVDGGWFVLNHGKYREMRSQKQIATAKRVAKHRAARKSAQPNGTPVTGNEVTRHNAPEADPEADPNQRERDARAGSAWKFPDGWEPAKAERDLALKLGLDWRFELERVLDITFTCAERDPTKRFRSWLRDEASRGGSKKPEQVARPRPESRRLDLE